MNKVLRAEAEVIINIEILLLLYNSLIDSFRNYFIKSRISLIFFNR